MDTGGIISSNLQNTEMNNFTIEKFWVQDVNFEDSSMRNGLFSYGTWAHVSIHNADLNETSFIEVDALTQVDLSCTNNPICN
jgi:uncharacterized protein YjbI with pentapeptide repeats